VPRPAQPPPAVILTPAVEPVRWRRSPSPWGPPSPPCDAGSVVTRQARVTSSTDVVIRESATPSPASPPARNVSALALVVGMSANDPAPGADTAVAARQIHGVASLRSRDPDGSGTPDPVPMTVRGVRWPPRRHRSRPGCSAPWCLACSCGAVEADPRVPINPSLPRRRLSSLQSHQPHLHQLSHGA
jgi:hypothetical protein